MRGKPHRQKPDLDNLVKAFKDALLKDDKGVHTYGIMQKIWGDTGEIVVLDAKTQLQKIDINLVDKL